MFSDFATPALLSNKFKNMLIKRVFGELTKMFVSTRVIKVY